MVHTDRVRVSVVLVSYNTREHLRACLDSLMPEEVHEVIVVDNASMDGSPELAATYSSVKVITNRKNVGFGRACNEGMDAATGDLILILNSDIVVAPGAISILAHAFENPDVVAAGGALVDEHGRVQDSCASELTLWAVFCEQLLLEKAFKNSRLFSPYWVTHRLDGDGEVFQVMGACLMMRPVERFDPEYFLYCEDTDLCYRLRKHGTIRYIPSARFEHALGASSSGNRWRSIAFYNRGKELYFAKHRSRFAAAVCWVLNRFGALLRLVIKPKSAGIFWRVLTAPVKGPPLPPDA